MGMNLMHTGGPARDSKDIWSKIKSVAGSDGMIYLDDQTVTAIARILKHAELNNGESITAHVFESDYASSVEAFGPSILSAELQDLVRAQLANDPNGQDAIALFDLIISLGIQIEFQGRDFIEARVKAVNWAADEVEIRSSAGGMYSMLRLLQIPFDASLEAGQIALDAFETAVAKHGHRLGDTSRLQAFIDCAKRHQSTEVYWA